MGQSRGVLRFEDSRLGQRHWLLIPSSWDIPGAEELLREAWAELHSLSPVLAQRLEAGLGLEQAAARLLDAVRFRKETAAPRGLIAWPSGESLIRTARETLAAGAKASVGKRAYFGNSHSGIAQRYLAATYMGQTGVGSYIVTALTPVLGLEDEGVQGPMHDIHAQPQGREITLAVSAALTGAVEALEHYKSTKSPAGFRDAVSRGLSVELVRGLIGLAEEADEATIRVDFDAHSVPLIGEELPIAFEFSAADVPALQVAAITLAQEPAPALEQSVRGRVHLLTKAEVDGPGVVGIDTGAGKYRLRLSPDDYSRAVRAHEVEAVVVARGIPSREGNINWLYDARLTGIEGSTDLLF